MKEPLGFPWIDYSGQLRTALTHLSMFRGRLLISSLNSEMRW